MELKMLNKSKVAEVVPGAVEGARSATGSAPGAAAEVKRWSANRKKEVVLRLLRGEPVDAVSRDVSVPIYRLEEWRDRALAGMDAGLKERENDPLEAKLGDATRRIGELVMEVELLRKERQVRGPLANRRSSK
jgi:transposase